MPLLKFVHNLPSSCAQEEKDKALTLSLHAQFGGDLLQRELLFAHFTSSGFVVNKSHTKGLFVMHNIYNTFSLPGGHCDGEGDFLAVATREIAEETGLKNISLLREAPIAFDVLPVKSHIKHGAFVSAHLHLSPVFLFEACEDAPLSVCPQENSQVCWLPLDGIQSYNMEPYMKTVYEKIIARL